MDCSGTMNTRRWIDAAQLALYHPDWWRAYLRGGRAELLRAVVRSDIVALRAKNLPSSFDELAHRRSVGSLGKLGSPQEYLYFVVRLLKPRALVETGVFRGVSTAFILAALADNGSGHLHSIDLPNASYVTDGNRNLVYRDATGRWSESETGLAIPRELRTHWTLHLGDSKSILPPLLESLGTIDFFFHDSEHTYETMTWEYLQALRHLRPGGLLASDDVFWNSAFQDFTAAHPHAWHETILGRLGLMLLSPA